jgi:hypothetical protein
LPGLYCFRLQLSADLASVVVVIAPILLIQLVDGVRNLLVGEFAVAMLLL